MSINCFFCERGALVGQFDICNLLDEVCFSSEDGKTKYDLGNGESTFDPNEAMGYQLEKWFHQILVHGQDVVFIPDVYIYGKKLASKLVVRTDVPRPVESQDFLSSKNTLKGLEKEEDFFNALRSALLKLQVKDAAVITGWKKKDSRGNTTNEFDFLIVSAALRSIIHIEAKASLYHKAVKKAGQQLKNGFSLFKEVVPLPESEKWKYAKFMYFHSVGTKINPCSKCQPYILSPSESSVDLSNWWSDLSASTHSSDDEGNVRETFLKVVKYLLHEMYVCKAPVTEGDIVRHTDDVSQSICTERTLFFWSSSQYNNLNDCRHKKKAFTSPYGTGKTLLLQSKAKELSRKGEKVLYVVFSETKEETVVQKEAKNLFLNDPNVQYKPMKLPDKKSSENLRKLLDENKDRHIFMDETPIGTSGIKSDFICELAEKTSDESLFWVACQAEKSFDKSAMEEMFKLIELKHQFRYAANVLETAYKHQETFKDTKWVKTNEETAAPFKYFLNRGNRATFLTLEKDAAFVLVVKQLAHILNLEKTKAIIHINIKEGPSEIVEALCCTEISERICEEEEDDGLDKFVASKDKIFIAKTLSLLSGCQVPIVVLISTYTDGNLNEKLFSRCTSHLIVVCDRDHAAQVVTSNDECQFAKCIPVYEELMPNVIEEAISDNDSDLISKYLKDESRCVKGDVRNVKSHTGLMISCSFGNLKVAKIFLEVSVSLEDVDALGWTALHHAVTGKSLECIKMLIEKGAKIESTTNTGETALHIAARTSSDMTKYLLEKGANLVSKDNFRWTPLHTAVNSGSLECVRLLTSAISKTDSKKDIDAETDRKLTPLHFAVRMGKVDLARELVNCGADITIVQTPKKYRTPLYLATKNGHLEMVKFLCETADSQNKKVEIPFRFACWDSHMDVIEYFLTEQNVPEKELKSGFEEACKHNQLDVVKYLIDKDLVNDFEKGYSNASVMGHSKIVELCKVKNFNFFFVTACSFGRLENVKYLELKIKDLGKGFVQACTCGQLEVVRYLTDTKKVANSFNEGFSKACINGQLNVVKHFVESKLPVDLEGGLRQAAKNRKESVENYLRHKIETGTKIQPIQ